MYPIRQIRNEFPCLKKFIYADSAARNPLCKRVRKAIENYLDDRQSGEDIKKNWFNKVEEVREKVATLINAENNEIAFVKNTSDGINCTGMALPWEKEDNIIISPEYEHPNNVYAWLGLQKRLGITIKMLQSKEERPQIKEIESLIDQKTRCIAISSVSFTLGGKTDIDEILSMCQKHNLITLID